MALLASYSADLGSIGATLLALAGKDTDSGRGSPSDFADAVERLRGKVRIVIQRGRLAKMRRTPRIAAVLDQFVREVDFDEASHSWHPKAALVRTLSVSGEIGWRLWIGSRNLTECVNRDIGLLLISGAKGGAPIPGADELARALADRAALKGLRAASLAATIAKVGWRPPAGVRVEQILWSAGSGDQPIPVPPAGTDEEKGLKALLGSARLVEALSMEHSPDADALEEEALERARTQVAARWAVVLSVDDEGVRLTHRSDLYPSGPHPDEVDIVLEVGALHDEPIAWPAQQVVVHLGPVVQAERSEFVRLRVSRGDKGLSWLQRAPAEPPFGEDRDRAAFVRFLGARGFLLWVAGLLADDGRQGEGDWTNDDLQARVGLGTNPTLDWSLPTLEEMLAAWARDPDKFREIERRVSQYLPAVLDQADREEPQTALILKRFDVLWSKLRSGLGAAEIKGRRR